MDTDLVYSSTILMDLYPSQWFLHLDIYVTHFQLLELPFNHFMACLQTMKKLGQILAFWRWVQFHHHQ